jgi:hypothetical protein
MEEWLNKNLLPFSSWEAVLNHGGDRVYSAMFNGPADRRISIIAFLHAMSIQEGGLNGPEVIIALQEVGAHSIMKDESGALLAVTITQKSYDALEEDLSDFADRLSEFIRPLTGNPTIFEPLAIALPDRRPEGGSYSGLHIV